MDLFQHELEDAVVALQASDATTDSKLADLEARVAALEAAAGGALSSGGDTVLNQEVSS